jgi:pimeloyl-ACP methyl ester carboxylesterase
MIAELVILGVVLLFIVPAVLFYLLQHKVIFSPQHYTSRQLFAEYPQRYHAVVLMVAQRFRLEGIVYEPEKEALCTVLYFGGKEQDSASLVGKFSVHYPDVRVISFNYRGYGTSGGKPTEKSLHADALSAYDWACARYGQVGLAGYSLGSNVAAYVASRRSTPWVVLVAAFDSVVSLAKSKFALLPRWLIRYKLETVKYVKNIKSPLYLYAATDDTIVPISHSRHLKSNVLNLAEYKEFGGYNHGELLFSDEVTSELKKVFEK